MAAAGAVESIIVIMSIKNGLIPPNLKLEPEFDLNYVKDGPTNWPSLGRGRIAIKNSFGFDGLNASLCIGETTEF